MTQPTTPGDAIKQAAARHKASTDAIKDLSRRLEEERRGTPGEAADAATIPQP